MTVEDPGDSGAPEPAFGVRDNLPPEALAAARKRAVGAPIGPTTGIGQPTTRWIWIIVFLLVATIVGGVAGLLAEAGGANIPTAILTGGGAFAGTVLLLLALAHYAQLKG